MVSISHVNIRVDTIGRANASISAGCMILF